MIFSENKSGASAIALQELINVIIAGEGRRMIFIVEKYLCLATCLICGMARMNP